MKTYFESLSKEDRKAHVKAVERLQKMRDQREKPDKEKNNLSYSQSYDLNREADLAYSDLSSLVQKEEEQIIKK